MGEGSRNVATTGVENQRSKKDACLGIWLKAEVEILVLLYLKFFVSVQIYRQA